MPRTPKDTLATLEDTIAQAADSLIGLDDLISHIHRRLARVRPAQPPM